MINTSTKLLFMDTSAHYVLANRKDPVHGKAKQFLSSLSSQNVIIVVTNFIIAEIYTLILRRLGRENAIQYVSNLSMSSWIIRVSEEDEKTGWNILLRYQDKDFSYVDAVSFAVMERLKIKEIFAFDEHFEQYGFRLLPT